jgi:hypothetical protein
MGLQLQVKHFKISSLVRNWYYFIAGIKFCRKHGGRLFDYYPACANSLCAVWNLSQLSISLPRTIIDVGAHDSEFSRLLLLVNPDAHLISFEPHL